jgi:hypothetical protein
MRRKTTELKGGWKARRRKRLNVEPWHNGTAASTALSTGEAANQRVSTLRRVVEPAGIVPIA